MDSAERIAVQKGLDQLRPYLAAFVEQALGSPQGGQTSSKSRDLRSRSDVYALLKVIKEQWQPVFRSLLPTAARSYVFELLDIRNRWAHQEPFSPEDAGRALDTIQQMARVIAAPLVPRDRPRPNSQVVTGETRVTGTGRRKVSQRDMMRDLFAKWSDSPERLLTEYAAAERRGEVSRKNNKSQLSPEEYARALLADGQIKGWLKG